MENKKKIPATKPEKLREQPITEETNDAEITPGELALLDASDDNSGEEDDLRLTGSRLDDTDDDNEPLNEGSSDLSGDDLDIPGSEDDDENEEIGEEDEENNGYSLDKQE